MKMYLTKNNHVEKQLYYSLAIMKKYNNTPLKNYLLESDPHI